MEEQKKCNKCKVVQPVAAFLSSWTKQIVKRCVGCRERNNFLVEEKVKKKKDALNPTTHQFCSGCNNACVFSEFSTKSNGELMKKCIACVARLYQDKKRRKDANPDKFRAQRKIYQTSSYTKTKADPVKWRSLLDHHNIYRKKNNDSDANYFTVLKSNAKRRCIDVKISIEFVAFLRSLNCYYCDAEGRLGIDRYDNSIGYTLDNCVACCTLCNIIKLDWDTEGFVMLVGHISAFGGRYGRLCPELLPASNSPKTMRHYTAKSKKKDREMAMTLEMFEALQEQSCYLCGRAGPGGVDRFDNDIGYVEGNLRPCCSVCNYAKLTSKKDEFVLHCERIFRNCEDHLDIVGAYDRGFVIHKNKYIKKK